MNAEEVIVEVGAGGGTISLLGRRNLDGTWHFMRKTNESFHSAILSDEDKEGISFETSHGSVQTIAEGLELLNKYPWHQLYPLRVHPEFQQSVYDTVIELTKADGGKNRNLYEWKIECGVPLD